GTEPVPRMRTSFLPEPIAAPGMWMRQLFNHAAWKRCVALHLRTIRPDVVITQQETSAAVVQAARTEGVRSMVMIRGTDFLDLPERRNPVAWRHYLQAPAFLEARRRYLASLRRADAVVANSRFICGVYEPLIGRAADVVY